tara:strand:+ start:820 stop:1194 length:375 start_codon:yes stop_codon:yes gene_type:complete
VNTIALIQNGRMSVPNAEQHSLIKGCTGYLAHIAKKKKKKMPRPKTDFKSARIQIRTAVRRLALGERAFMKRPTLQKLALCYFIQEAGQEFAGDFIEKIENQLMERIQKSQVEEVLRDFEIDDN